MQRPRIDLRDAAIEALIVAAAAAALAYPLFRTPLLPMIDGPYYAVQVRWILEKGHMLYPDPPLIFYIMALAALLTGDIFTGVKIVAALMPALTAIPWYHYYRRRGRPAAAGAALAATLNPWMMRMASDFMKNAAGTLWLSAFIVEATLYLEQPTRRRLALSALFLTLTALTHILDLAVAIFYAILQPLIHLALTRKPDPRRLLPPAAALALLAALFAAPAIVGGDVYKGLALLHDAATGTLQPKPPDLLTALGVAAALAAASRAAEPAEASLDIASAALAPLLVLPALPQKWLFRLRNMETTPIAVAAGSSLRGLPPRAALPALALITALLAAQATALYPAIRPTITPSQHADLARALAYAQSHGLSVVVREPPLRYWAQTLADNVYADPEQAPRPLCFLAPADTPQPALWRGTYYALTRSPPPPRHRPPSRPPPP